MVSDEGLNAYGAVTWGQFFIYQGFNATAGWMHTSSGVDNIDEFLESPPLRTRTITIPFQTDSGMSRKTFTVSYSQHGPVVRKEGDRLVSISLMSNHVSALMQSYTRTKAHDLTGFRQILELHTNSSNNTVFADAAGNIAYFHSNYIPRRDTSFDWTKPVDGSNPAAAYRGVLSFDETPNVVNPSSGWVYNSNNWPWSAAGAGSSPKREEYPRYVETGTDASPRPWMRSPVISEPGKRRGARSIASSGSTTTSRRISTTPLRAFRCRSPQACGARSRRSAPAPIPIPRSGTARAATASSRSSSSATACARRPSRRAAKAATSARRISTTRPSATAPAGCGTSISTAHTSPATRSADTTPVRDEDSALHHGCDPLLRSRGTRATGGGRGGARISRQAGRHPLAGHAKGGQPVWRQLRAPDGVRLSRRRLRPRRPQADDRRGHGAVRAHGLGRIAAHVLGRLGSVGQRGESHRQRSPGSLGLSHRSRQRARHFYAVQSDPALQLQLAGRTR